MAAVSGINDDFVNFESEDTYQRPVTLVCFRRADSGRRSSRTTFLCSGTTHRYSRSIHRTGSVGFGRRRTGSVPDESTFRKWRLLFEFEVNGLLIKKTRHWKGRKVRSSIPHRLYMCRRAV